MSLSTEEEQEMERLEIEFEAAGGRSIGTAERLDFLRTKSAYPTVAEFIAELSNLSDPEHTFVVLTASEVDYPMAFVALDEILGDCQ